MKRYIAKFNKWRLNKIIEKLKFYNDKISIIEEQIRYSQSKVDDCWPTAWVGIMSAQSRHSKYSFKENISKLKKKLDNLVSKPGIDDDYIKKVSKSLDDVIWYHKYRSLWKHQYEDLKKIAGPNDDGTDPKKMLYKYRRAFEHQPFLAQV